MNNARRELTAPSQRLAAELGWLPGVRQEEMHQAWAIQWPSRLLAMRTDLLPLAKANLLASVLESFSLNGWEQESLLEYWSSGK